MNRRLLHRLAHPCWMLLCAATLLWSLWSLSASAAETNAAAPATTDFAAKASALTRTLIDEEFVQSHQTELSFGINRSMPHPSSTSSWRSCSPGPLTAFSRRV
jgi:hypothetical protein